MAFGSIYCLYFNNTCTFLLQRRAQSSWQAGYMACAESAILTLVYCVVTTAARKYSRRRTIPTTAWSGGGPHNICGGKPQVARWDQASNTEHSCGCRCTQYCTHFLNHDLISDLHNKRKDDTFNSCSSTPRLTEMRLRERRRSQHLLPSLPVVPLRSAKHYKPLHVMVASLSIS